MKKFLLVIILFITNYAFADCDFKTGNYIEKLSNPKYLSSLEIKIPKSAKFTQNAFQIITLKSDTIPTELKKKFKAIVLVNYKFGQCKYSATVRQSGDWRDHIIFKNAQVIRSVDIKLHEGNILNAVKFKLLIPETRNGFNEILASLILRKLDFISPETFEVKTTINEVRSVMLFQEKEAKENLERHSKREGPIFEGDERMIWSYKNFRNFELEPLSLSRMVNDEWFMRGRNSQSITLEAYERLQEAYMDYAYDNLRKSSLYTIFPNSLVNKKFINYHATLIAMNASHALRPHNRKYYYNAIESSFEPIYYDGNVDFSLPLSLNEAYDLLPYSLDEKFKEKLFNLLENNQLLNELFDEFSNRLYSDFDKKKFLNIMDQFKKNLNLLIKKINSKSTNHNNQTNHDHNSIKWYQNFQKDKSVNQFLFKDIFYEKNKYFIKSFDDENYQISEKELLEILSKNKWNNKRAVYIPSRIKTKIDKEAKYLKIEKKLIKMSKTMDLKIDEDNKNLFLTQNKSSDWILISGGDYSGWKFYFNGLPINKLVKEKESQRFNNHGLTGCLNMHNTLIDNASFLISNGNCEDSINIIRSKGENIIIKINNAKADALDIDFSKLSIKYIDVESAGNDCLDVSAGNYYIKKAKFTNCKDKALSVGEKSNLELDEISVIKSNIGVSAKDLSDVKIKYLKAMEVNLCTEVKQKKQEFGGARLFLNKNECSASNSIDSMSVYFAN